MPSDVTDASAAPRDRGWAWLSSQGLGVLCGQGTVLLFAVGSVVIASTRDGASAGIQMDDLRGFFAEPSMAHLWFYALVPTLGLYGLNTLLATWKNVSRKWRLGMRSPGDYAAAVIHLSFLVALFAHLVGGLGSTEQGRVTLGPAWREIGDGSRARVAAMKVDRQPDRSLGQVRATVEVSSRGGAITRSTLAYNQPISSGLGSDLMLLVRPAAVPGQAHIVRGRDRCQLEEDDTCELGDLKARLMFVHPPPRPGGGALARVRFKASTDGAAQDVWLMQGRRVKIADGSIVVLERIDTRPAVVLRRRHAPGNPWAFFSAVMLAVGLSMMWRRLL